MRIHYLSPIALNAPLLSPTGARVKVRAGWTWHRLIPGFTTTGGVANYNRALVSPTGLVAFISDRADGPAADAALPCVEIDHSLVRLNVPFTEKAEAKQLGAVWIGHHKTWTCAPDRADEFRRWITGEVEVLDLMAPAL